MGTIGCLIAEANVITKVLLDSFAQLWRKPAGRAGSEPRRFSAHRRRGALLNDFPRIRVVDNPRRTDQRATSNCAACSGTRLEAGPARAGRPFSTFTQRERERSASAPGSAETRSDDQAYVIQVFVKPFATVLFTSDSGERDRAQPSAFG
jgi:hypothetical protein